MKTVVRKLPGRPAIYLRLDNKEAARFVEKFGYEYCPKDAWKRDVRDAGKAVDDGK